MQLNNRTSLYEALLWTVCERKENRPDLESSEESKLFTQAVWPLEPLNTRASMKGKTGLHPSHSAHTASVIHCQLKQVLPLTAFLVRATARFTFILILLGLEDLVKMKTHVVAEVMFHNTTHYRKALQIQKCAQNTEIRSKYRKWQRKGFQRKSKGDGHVRLLLLYSCRCLLLNLCICISVFSVRFPYLLRISVMCCEIDEDVFLLFLCFVHLHMFS